MIEYSERWAPVLGYAGWYEVSDLGRIQSCKKWLRTRHVDRLYKQTITPLVGSGGYLYVNLGNSDGTHTTFLVHKLVLEAFVSPKPTGLQTAHKNGVRTDNRLINLMWATPSENTLHKAAHGTILRGEKIKGSHLKEDQAREMRALYAGGGVSYKQIAGLFGVHTMCAFRAIKKESWAHVV